MKPKLVIFDCDGVLVETEALAAQVMRDNLERHGLNLSLSECVAHFTGVADEDVIGIVAGMGVALPKNWLREITDETHVFLEKGIDVVPGIPALLDHLDRIGIPFCVASNSLLVRMEITLGQHGLWGRFQGKTFSAPDLGVFKPDPDLFLIAAREMGHQPADCVVIEDSTTGAKAARRAHIRCFGYAPDGGGQGLLDQGATLFASMADLPGLLGL